MLARKLKERDLKILWWGWGLANSVGLSREAEWMGLVWAVHVLVSGQQTNL